MKYANKIAFIYLLLLIFGSTILLAQGTNNITDGFDDGDFTKDPEWIANSEDWFINDRLQLQSSKKDSSGQSSITTKIPQANTYKWSFKVMFDASPTINNAIYIYLLSSDSDLKNKPAGYFIEMVSSSEIKLKERKTNSSNAYTLTSLKTDLSKGIRKDISVSYDTDHGWKLTITNEDNSSNTATAPSSNAMVNGSFFGFFINYTKTRSDKFIFSKVSIEYLSSTPEPPPIDPEEEPIYKYNDLVINEILFNPNTDGVPFVELYNKSQYDLNLKFLKIATLKDDGDIKYSKAISKDDLILASGSYITLTNSLQILQEQYHCPYPENLFELKLPSLTTKNGTVAIIQNDTVIDKVCYNENMHYPMLNSFKGISLERINFDSPSNESTSFHSSSADVGFATPGYQNSQFTNNHNDNTSIFTLSSKIIRPGVHGINNILEISYRMDGPGYLATIMIYDEFGHLIKTICNNVLMGIEGSYFWDGLNDRNQVVKQGRYIINAQVINPAIGKVKKFVDAFAIIHKH